MEIGSPLIGVGIDSPEMRIKLLEMIGDKPIQPVGSKTRGFYGGRRFLEPDGSWITLLELMATVKFGSEYDRENQRAYWKDKNPENETFENVGLVTLKYGRQPSPIGVPAGTAEYQREWQKRNREKIREAQKRYRQKIARTLQEHVRGQSRRARKIREESSIDQTPGINQEQFERIFEDQPFEASDRIGFTGESVGNVDYEPEK